MGDLSSLRFVPASSSSTLIHWTRVQEPTKKLIVELEYAYDQKKDKFKPLPATIGDLAKMFNETKFFGYLKSDILTILMDISEFGLKPRRGVPGMAPVGPRFYMTYLNQVWFFLFAPGKRDCVVGHSNDIIRKRNDRDYEKWAADDTAMAQVFDVRLVEDVGRGMDLLVKLTNKLSGWTALTSQFCLEYTQFADAITTLPREHPAYRGLMEDTFRPLFHDYHVR